MRCVYHDGLRYHQVEEITDFRAVRLGDGRRGLRIEGVADGVPTTSSTASPSANTPTSKDSATSRCPGRR